MVYNFMHISVCLYDYIYRTSLSKNIINDGIIFEATNDFIRRDIVLLS